MSQKIIASIADQMLLVLNSDTITEYAWNNTKFANMLSGENIESTVTVCVVSTVV